MLTLLSFGILVSVFCFIYENKMNRSKMHDDDEIDNVTFLCSNFCFRLRRWG
jgi:hypothetical protein